MKRVHCIVEGQTEVAFFSSILNPYINKKTGADIQFTPIKHSGGGIVPYAKLLRELREHLRDKDKILTTFFDYYGILERHQFPNFKKAKIDQADPKIGVKLLEKGIKEHIESEGISTKNFIPYIQLHEFEALLFSSDDGFDFQYDNEKVLKELKGIVQCYRNPEDINDNPETAPSKRIIKALEKQNEKYSKVIDGATIASQIGIEKIREKCPRFSHWLTELINKILE